MVIELGPCPFACMSMCEKDQTDSIREPKLLEPTYFPLLLPSTHRGLNLSMSYLTELSFVAMGTIFMNSSKQPQPTHSTRDQIFD